MIRAASAGVVYFGLVFAVGFVLGTVRVLLVVPHFGELVAVVMELPLILTAAWVICHRVSARFVVQPSWEARLTMAGIAFTLLIVAELVLAITLFGRSIGEHFRGYATPHGVIGLVGQVVFAAFPLMQVARRAQIKT